MTPNIVAMMPTIESHAKFLAQARQSFDQQVYPKDWLVNLLVDHNSTETLGMKLNRMTQDAIELGATHVILLDDDDQHSPHRIQAQISPLLANPNLTMTGTSTIVYEKENGEVWRYSGHAALWIGGLAFPVSSWQRFTFANITAGTDTAWQKNFPVETKCDLKDESLMLARMHSANSSAKSTAGSMWQRLTELPESLRAQ